MKKGRKIKRESKTRGNTKEIYIYIYICLEGEEGDIKRNLR